MKSYKFEPNSELLGFAETFSTNWNLIGPGDYISPGEKRYHIKYVDKISTDGVEIPQNIVIEPSGMIIISKAKLEALETNPDYLFYKIIWCIIEKDIQFYPDSDIHAMDFCMKAGCNIKNIMYGIGSELSSYDNELDNQRIHALVEYVKGKLKKNK